MAAHSKYRPWFPELVTWMARQGLTLPEIARELKVNVTTVGKWRKKYPDFAAALNEGLDIADARVEASLYKRAIGFTRTVEKLSKDGDAIACEEEVPGDVTACIFWLKNRRPDRWRDVQRHEHTGEDGKPIQHEHDYSKLSDAELEAAIVAEAELITGRAATSPAVGPAQPDGQAEGVS